MSKHLFMDRKGNLLPEGPVGTRTFDVEAKASFLTLTNQPHPSTSCLLLCVSTFVLVVLLMAG